VRNWFQAFAFKCNVYRYNPGDKWREQYRQEGEDSAGKSE
jgi:hypothetical protein